MFARWHTQRHFVFLKRYDEQFQRQSGNFLLLNSDDLSDAVSRVNNKLIGFEAMAIARRRPRR